MLDRLLREARDDRAGGVCGDGGGAVCGGAEIFERITTSTGGFGGGEAGVGCADAEASFD